MWEFDGLSSAKTYAVCAQPKVGQTLSSQLSNLDCKNVSTICMDLPQPTGNLIQKEVYDDGNIFDAFRSAVIEWNESTFDKSISGDLTYFAR